MTLLFWRPMVYLSVGKSCVEVLSLQLQLQGIREGVCEDHLCLPRSQVV